MTSVETLIVGAGPAGLAVAGRLHKQNKTFTIVEKAENVASSWRSHYDRLHLHTVKQLSHLPHLSYPESYPTYVSRDQLIAYMESYIKTFDIKPVYNCSVENIGERADDGSRIINTSNSQSYTAQNIVIATGVNRVPNSPSWPGQELFDGEIVHSRFYKNAEPYVGKRVLVVGFG
ncbi:MAG: NAD(P)/FAD-dependent oxidoreductase, partial [Calditrichota bacterium]